MPSISFCMIVRDEESEIARCLESVRGIAGEMIVVDTGSTDRTKEICRSMGAAIWEFVWCQDFSAARNFGLEKARGDWILWLDADEALCLEDREFFLQAIFASKETFLSLDMMHYYGDSPPEASRSYHSAGFRLFRNHCGIRFSGRIHEHLEAGNAALPTRTLPGALIHHNGYLDCYVQAKQKSERNLSLLLQERKGTDDPWISYHVAGEYYRRQDFQQAYEEVNEAIRSFLQRGSLPPALAYKMKYEILLHVGSSSSALKGIEKALLLYPDYVDLHYYHGLMLFERGRFLEAELCFEHCLALGENNPAYLILAGTGSFFALFYLALCRKGTQMLEQARQSDPQAPAALLPELGANTKQ